MEIHELLEKVRLLGEEANRVEVPEPAPAQPALPDLYDIFATYFQESEREQAPRIRPSALGVTLHGEDTPCALSWWGQMQGLSTRPVSVGEAMMFDHGNRLHERLGQILVEQLPRYGWFVVGVEKRVSYNSIYGTLDLLIEHARTGYRLVIDFKTKRGNAFKYLDEAKRDNVLQVQFYVEAADADGGMLLYVDREGQNFVKSFFVPRAKELVDEAIRQSYEFIDPEIFPEGPPPVGLTLERRQNKGPDSIYLKTPWQMDWCKLETCLCRQKLPALPPDGIIAKISNDGLVEMTEGNEKWKDVVVNRLRETYPDEEFHVEGDLFE